MQCIDDCYKEAFIKTFYKQKLAAQKALDLVRNHTAKRAPKPRS